MSTCSAANGFADFWIADHDPGNSEIPIAGSIAIYNHYMNIVTNAMFICLNSTIGSQTWLQVSALTKVFSQPTFSNITTATQLSATRDAMVSYVFPVSATVIAGTITINAILQYADDAGMTTNVITLPSDNFSIGGVLNINYAGRLQCGGIVPAGKYRKVTFSQTGGGTLPTTVSQSQEVLL